MDPVSAFSLAGTILQFLDSGARFVGLAQDLYQDGLSDHDRHVHVLKVTEDLQKLLPELRSEDNSSGKEDSLTQLANNCNKTASRLVNILQKVKNGQNTRKRDAVKSAFRLLCKENEMMSLQGQLSSFREQLNLHLLLSLRKHAATSVEQQKAVLEELNIVRDQTLQVYGISASIFEYFVSHNLKPEDRAQEIQDLQVKLLRTAYGQAHDEDYDPPVIHLPPEDRHKAQSLLLAEIQYDSMIDRQDRIAIAHEATFQWIFHDDQTESSNSNRRDWSSFRKWLESDEQVYWITGKAGSGKSTLMKFLCSPTSLIIQTKPRQDVQKGKVGEEPDQAGQPNFSQGLREMGFGQVQSDQVNHPESLQVPQEISLSQEQSRCHPYLRRWANTSRLVVASFYFWNSGMELQMTTMGLLRTILYQICAQRPDLLHNLMPRQWESACLFGRSHVGGGTLEWVKTFFRVIRLLSKDSKICIFIDGLDEFGNDHEELISLVHSLVEHNAHVKVCVASRPWNIFQRTLGHNANLRLEDLTFDDIKIFVQSKFKANPGFDNLRQRYPSFADRLMDNIVVKASGVFLWVDLVVASLLAGMQLGDRIEDFQRRLDELPPELENLYEKILQSLDPFYLGHAAQYFTLVEASESPLTVLQFSFADEESPMSAMELEAGSMAGGGLSLRIEAMKRRLNSRCKGFLEVDRGSHRAQENEATQHSQLTVQYLHRTVRDFIKTPKVQDFLQVSTKSNFDPSIQLCVAYLMSIKWWQDPKTETTRFDPFDQAARIPPSSVHVIQCLMQASRVLKMNEGAMIAMMEHLKMLITQPSFRDYLMKDSKAYRDSHSGQNPRAMLATGRDSQLSRTRSNILDNSTWGMESFAVLPDDRSFLSLAVVYNIVPYVSVNAQSGGLTHRSTSQTLDERFPLLYDALSRDVPDPRMVECLLDIGADPNFRMMKVDSTPWSLALTKVTMLYTLHQTINSPEEYSAAEDKWKETLKLMYTRGGMYAKVPDSFLSPICRKILRDIINEVKMTEKSHSKPKSWLDSLWMG